MSSAAQPLKQAHRESPICTGLRIRTLLQKLISRLMLLFNVASSKLWIKLLACRWQVAMLDLQVLSGNQSRHSCNRAALSRACSLNAVQWLQKKRILVTMSVGIDIFCSYHILLTHISSINIWFHSLCNGLQLPEPGESNRETWFARSSPCSAGGMDWSGVSVLHWQFQD